MTIQDIIKNNILFQPLEKFEIPLAVVSDINKPLWLTKRFSDITGINSATTDVFAALNVSVDSLLKENFFFAPNIFGEINIFAVKTEDEKFYIIFINEAKSLHGILNQRLQNITNFAHDLNNILMGILNGSSALLSEIPAGSPDSHLISSLHSNSQRAVDLIGKIMSRGEARNSKKSRINLTNLLLDLQNTVNSLSDKDIEFVFSIEDKLNAVTANYSDLYRALLNLCTNSVEAIDNKGRIFISASNLEKTKPGSSSDKFVRISIRDTGSGVEKENLDKLFDAGFSTKDSGIISGIGLNIVKEIIEDHKGTIELTSEINSGTEFIITLPARIDDEKPISFNPEEKTILLAEDEKTILLLLKDLFESYKYNVIIATTGKEVIEAYEKYQNIDLFVIDRKMPVMSGLTCIAKLRELNCNKPIILTSGSSSVDEDFDYGSLNIVKILTKPYDFIELLEIVKSLIAV